MNSGLPPALPGVSAAHMPRLQAEILNAVSDAVAMVDEAGVIVYANAAAEHMYGYEPGELAGKPSLPASGWPEGEAARRLAEVREVVNAGGVWEGDWLVRRTDGLVSRTGCRVTPLRGDTELYFLWIWQPVRERRVEAAEYARLALDAAGMGDWRWDALTDEVVLSERAAAIFGLPAHRTTTWSHLQTLLHPDDREAARMRVQAAIASGVDYDIEYRLTGERREGRCVLAKGRAVSDRDGRVTGMVGVVADLTERKELLRREREARATAELLNSVGPLLTGELNPEKLVQSVTDLATRLVGAQFGALFHNVLNQNGESYMLYTLSGVPREAFSKFPMPRNTAVFAPTFHGEGIIRSDDITRDARYGKSAPYYGMPKGHLPVRSYLAVPVVSRTGTVIGGLFFGHGEPGRFTDQHEQLVAGIAAQAAVAMDNAQLFEQLNNERVKVEDANAELRRVNSDLEQFAYSASHDLQEPLRMIAIYSQLLRKRFSGQLGAQGEEYIRYTIEGATRIENLVRDLLTYTRAARPADGVPELVDANEALARSLTDLQVTIAETGALVEADKLPVIRMPRLHLEQLFQNLIGNAIKYRSQEPPRVKISASLANGEWLFSVADNGIGIDPQYKEHIFGIFKRLHTPAEYSGTGMGLAICQRVVERNGGRIWVESELGRGATFHFTVPAGSEGTDRGQAGEHNSAGGG